MRITDRDKVLSLLERYGGYESFAKFMIGYQIKHSDELRTGTRINDLVYKIADLSNRMQNDTTPSGIDTLYEYITEIQACSDFLIDNDLA